MCEVVDPVVEHLGGIQLPLQQSDMSNASALVGREAVIHRLAHEFNDVIEAAVQDRIAELAQEIKEHPDRYWPPYEFPGGSASDDDDEWPSSIHRGRPKGDTNVTREYFWEQYRNAVDGFDGFPRMQRPYRKTHLQPRTSFGYKAFCKYLARWGAPPGYAKPGE